MDTLAEVFSRKFSKILRGNCPEVFCKKVVLRKFVIFTGKHMC